MTDIISLISQSETTDIYGDPVITETTKTVFCGVSSIGMKEFYQANASGFKPEIKFILADYLDYNDEKFISYDSKRYRVLRTYRNGHELEITCYREVN